MKSQIPDSYPAMIQQATGVADELLPVLERIMREDVFHSTLDWQTRSEFNRGAKKALALYQADADFHDAESAMRRASFALMKAETSVAQARESGDQIRTANAEKQLESARITERETRRVFEAYLSPLARSL